VEQTVRKPDPERSYRVLGEGLFEKWRYIGKNERGLWIMEKVGTFLPLRVGEMGETRVVDESEVRDA
jgi:hypothetical protein